MIAFARYAMVKFAGLLRKTKYLPVRLRGNAFARSKLHPSLQEPRLPGMPCYESARLLRVASGPSP